jgi:hypothetical protein
MLVEMSLSKWSGQVEEPASCAVVVDLAARTGKNANHCWSDRAFAGGWSLDGAHSFAPTAPEDAAGDDRDLGRGAFVEEGFDLFERLALGFREQKRGREEIDDGKAGEQVEHR